MPSCYSLAVELATPAPRQGDFAEIAHALSQLNRSSGSSLTPVLAGLRTLISRDFCPTAAVRARWLLHDCHKARLGDVSTPMKLATRWIACDLLRSEGHVPRRHDRPSPPHAGTFIEFLCAVEWARGAQAAENRRARVYGPSYPRGHGSAGRMGRTAG
ncbi:hypothetical protein ACRAWG_37030 [Methylobacterium sp. P31]